MPYTSDRAKPMVPEQLVLTVFDKEGVLHLFGDIRPTPKSRYRIYECRHKLPKAQLALFLEMAAQVKKYFTMEGYEVYIVEAY